MNDTQLNGTWVNIVKTAKAYGFKYGFCREFIGLTWVSYKKVEEKEAILYQEEKGLILYASSYDTNFVDVAHIYGEIKCNLKELDEKQLDALDNCTSYVDNKNGTVNIIVDAKEGLIPSLEALANAFEFSKTWSKVPSLDFLNYMNKKNKNCDCKRLSYEKINASLPEVHKIIFG